MISWLIIGILAILAILILKMNHFKHKIWILFIVLLVLFLYISISIVNDKYKLDLTTTDGVFHSFNIYLGWLANGFHNLRSLTGNAINMDWTETNASFLNKTTGK